MGQDPETVPRESLLTGFRKISIPNGSLSSCMLFNICEITSSGALKSSETEIIGVHCATTCVYYTEIACVSENDEGLKVIQRGIRVIAASRT
jgi:hypothetical protein